MSTTSSNHEPPLGLVAKARLALHVWRSFLIVRRELKRKPLPTFTRELGQTPVQNQRRSLVLLNRAVERSLRIGPYRPRCLLRALVLYRLLREQGDEPELVIGLLPDARDQSAHAWVELDGRDVGPPPGRGRHAAMARFS